MYQTRYHDNDCWEYEFNVGEQLDECQLKLHHAPGDKGTEAYRKNSDKSFNGYKHGEVDAEVQGQVSAITKIPQLAVDYS